MTPQERQLIDDLFDRLAKLENTPRDPEAMSAIMQGLRKAPNAVYALVQTALVQDEALKRANDRIQELEAGQCARADSIRRLPRSRCATRSSGRTSRAARCRTSAPPTWATARSGTAARRCSRPRTRTAASWSIWPGALWPARYGQPWRSRRLAAVAARSSEPRRRRPPAWSVARCCLAASGSMMGGGSHQQAFADASEPWRPKRKPASRGATSPSGDLARDAGINDIGSSSGQRADDSHGSRAGLFDQASNDDHDDMDDHDSDGFDDDGGDGDSDYA